MSIFNKTTAAVAIATALLSAPAQAMPFDIQVTYLPTGVIVDSDGDNDPMTGAQNPTVAFTARQQQLFGAAELFWEGILTGFTGVAAPTYQLSAWLTSEDGPDNSLAFAGPRQFETVGGFERAIAGEMQFDADDFGPDAPFGQPEQLFLDSAVHEIGHALGFGTLFDDNNLTLVNGGRDYTGANALSAFNIENGTSVTSILLGPNTGHWDECYVQGILNPPCVAQDGMNGEFNDTELMTPFAVDVPATVSATTIGAFRDLGYLTADPFAGFSIPLAANIVPLPPVTVSSPATVLLFSFGLFGVASTLRRKTKA